MDFCLICKEIVNRRYKANVKDTEQDNRLDGYICRNCWVSFNNSHYNKGPFRIMKFASWIKGDKDGKRV